VEPIKLLIVEDDADQRDLICETLEDHFGQGTVTAAESRAAAILHDPGSFDLILTDYNLSDACGMDLLDEIRRRCATPVIMVTGENIGHIAAEAIRHGATDYVVKFGDYLNTIPLVVEKNLTVAKVKQENEQLREQIEHAMTQLKFKNAQLQESLQLMEQMASTDPLTSLYNRRHFSRVLDQLFAEAQRYDNDLSCVMIDLDSYKQLNDKYGHQVGDQLLVAAGKVITANLRRMDVAARYGGDEFILLLPRAQTTEATAVAQRIREQYFLASAGVLKQENGVRMSVGIGSMKGNRAGNGGGGITGVSSAEQLVAQADKALYRAKEAGRDRIAVADMAAAATTLSATFPAA
jgi:diguanylate cyclase (GGDEF)-like protein